MGYLCANFSLPRPLCSRLRPDVRDRQTDRRHTSDAHHRLMPRTLEAGAYLTFTAATRRNVIRSHSARLPSHAIASVTEITKQADRTDRRVHCVSNGARCCPLSREPRAVRARKMRKGLFNGDGFVGCHRQ